jgi:hypothetical protein
MRKQNSMIPKSGYRFPACAKPLLTFVRSFDASAGEGRSEKVMRKQNSMIPKSARSYGVLGGGAPGRCAALTTPAWVNAAAICCMRFIRSTAAAGGSTKRHAG